MTDTATTRWGCHTRITDINTGKINYIHAAMACFELKGIDKTTIEDVTTMAATSRRTFYRYFDSKKDLENCVFEYQKNRLFYAMRKSILPLNKALADLFDASVVFASTYKPGQETGAAGLNRAYNDYIYLYATCRPDKWVTEWQYFYEDALSSKSYGAVDRAERERLAFLASRLVMIYRQLDDDADSIKQSLRSLRHK